MHRRYDRLNIPLQPLRTIVAIAGEPVAFVRDDVRKLVGCRNGASAVEFALVLPIFIMVLFGIIIYGSYIGTVHGVQQIAAEAARAAIGGLSDSERVELASTNIAENVASYPFLSESRLTLQSAATDASTSVFSVTVRYDASDSFIFDLPAFLPVPNKIIVRSAAIQRGGSTTNAARSQSHLQFFLWC